LDLYCAAGSSYAQRVQYPCEWGLIRRVLLHSYQYWHRGLVGKVDRTDNDHNVDATPRAEITCLITISPQVRYQQELSTSQILDI